MELKDCFKTYTLDQDKLFPPEETVNRVRAGLTRAGLDILKETARIDHGRLGIPVYISVCGADALEVMPTRKQMGKGATPAQAEASAVMEMVERYSFFHFFRRHPFIRATYGEVRQEALPLDQLAASVHHDPGDLDRAGRAIEGLPLSWTWAFNLTRGQKFLVPFNWFYEINEFNGPAAGNALEEAIIQGLAEVVERHVSALISRGRIEAPSIDPASLKNPVAADLVGKYQAQGIRLYLKDFTLDMGLPTVGTLAYDPATFPHLSEIVYTAGTATDPEKALIRALTETAQLAGDFNSRATFVASGLPKYTQLSQADYVTRPSRTVPIDTLPCICSDNIKTEIERAVAVLAERNFEAYVIDITHGKIQIPAVYTIIPGARFRERAQGASVPFFAAKILASLDDPAQAAAGLNHLSRLYPNRYFLAFYQGQIRLEQGRPDLAAEYFEKALTMDPEEEDLAGILTYLGLACQQMEEYGRAVDYLERSAAVDGERRDTFNLLGLCYFKTKEHEKAIGCFEKVLKIDPGSGIDYANIGSNYRELGRKEEAVRYYRKALELDPSLDWVRENLQKLG